MSRCVEANAASEPPYSIEGSMNLNNYKTPKTAALVDSRADTYQWATSHTQLEREAAMLRERLQEYIAAADHSMRSDDSVGAMLRFGEADKSAREALAATDPERKESSK